MYTILCLIVFFFNDTATTEIYTLSLHDALPISVLVCVRTPLAAQTVASTASRLGMTGVVRTAVSETEAMVRLAERPADVVLADTAVTRPDSVGFTRRGLARAPNAQVVQIGRASCRERV